MRVHVTDSNDNRPEFESDGGGLVAAVPTTAEYGHLVTNIQVKYEMLVEGEKGFLVTDQPDRQHYEPGNGLPMPGPVQ